MSATNLVEGIINDHPKKITEVQDEDIISLIHKDLQVQLKIIEKNLEIVRVTQRAEAGCYYKKKVRSKTLQIQKI